MKTQLGWLVIGKPDVKYVNHCDVFLLAQSNDIINLWNLEAIGIIDPWGRKNQEELE